MNYLQNHFLVALPGMSDNFFARSVVYLCEHNDKGAMGITLTSPLDMDDLYTLLTRMDFSQVSDSLTEVPVLAGGPLHTDRGFVLHSPQEGLHSTIQLTPELMLTTSLDIPARHRAAARALPYLAGLCRLGGGSTGAGVAGKQRLVLPATAEQIFDIPWDEKWLAISKAFGIDIWQVAPQADTPDAATAYGESV